jgi:hypothetical protein
MRDGKEKGRPAKWVARSSGLRVRLYQAKNKIAVNIGYDP